MTRYIVTITDVNDAHIEMNVVETEDAVAAILAHRWFVEPYRTEYLQDVLIKPCIDGDGVVDVDAVQQRIYSWLGWVVLCVDWNIVTMNVLNAGDSNAYSNQLTK